MSDLGWKVPFRSVYCDTFKACVKQTIWCHVVLKIFPDAHDFASDPVEQWLEEPGTMERQLGFYLERVARARNPFHYRQRYLADEIGGSSPDGG